MSLLTRNESNVDGVLLNEEAGGCSARKRMLRMIRVRYRVGWQPTVLAEGKFSPYSLLQVPEGAISFRTMIVGDGGLGKTCLSFAVAERRFLPNESMKKESEARLR